MKKILIGCGILLLIVIGLAVVGFIALPDSYSVEREIDVEAPPEEIYETLATPSTWPEWSAWNQEADPSATFEFSGPETGEGAKWSWTGDAFGEGTLTMIDTVRPERVIYELEMNMGPDDLHGTLTLTPTETGTHVHWLDEGQVSGVWKFMGPMADIMMGPMLEEGLQGLKARHETGD